MSQSSGGMPPAVEWILPEGQQPETWGALIAYLVQNGCELVDEDVALVGPCRYVQRRVAGVVLRHLLPKDFSDRRICRYTMAVKVVRRLQLQIPKWPVTL